MMTKARVYRIPQDPYDDALVPCWAWRHDCRAALRVGGNGTSRPHEVGTWRAVMRGALQHVSECNG